MNFRFLFFMGYLLAFTSCTSTSYFILKNHHFDTPETQGKPYKFKASFVGYQDVTAVVTDMSFSTTSPVQGDTEVVKNDNLEGLGADGLDHSSLLMDLALAKNMDLSVDLALGDQPNYFKLKYQFYGNREDSNNRFSASAIFGLGYISMDETDADLGTVFLNNFEVSGPVVRGALSVGLRADGGLLVYWSNSYSRFFTTTDYERELPLDNGSFNINGDQFSSMLGLNYVAAEKISLGVEYGLVYVNSDFADSDSFTSFAANVGFIF